MAQAREAFDGLKRLTGLDQAWPGAGTGRGALLDALDDIAEEARTAADCAGRADRTTLTISDQIAGIEDRVAAMRLGVTMFAAGQTVILSLILWRVW